MMVGTEKLPMYDALAGSHAGAHTLEDFALLSPQRLAIKKPTSKKSKAKPAALPPAASAFRKLHKPR
jgi:hypothetical protein